MIEYLLRNFKVHIYEQEWLIIYFLNYHGTGLYIKLI